jgi:hypothetical protein
VIGIDFKLNRRTKNSTSNKRKGFGHDMLLFLFGPLALLVLVRFTGYQIFCHGDPTDKERKRVVFLLSSGALFYLLMIILVAVTIE